MAVEMKKYKLSDLCDVFGRIGFRGYTVNDLVSKGQGAITFSPSDINNFTLSFDNCTYISLYKYEESPEIKVFNGDIIFTKTGSSIGKTAYVENLIEKATINPQFVVLKNFKCNSRYLFYILTSKWFQKNVWNIVVGSTVPTLSQEDFKKRELYLPERNIQDKAASALSAIDKRIENLRAQNRVLEQTAKAIYDYTFLQCAGHQTTYNKTLNRKVPVDWEVKKLGEIADFKNGINYDPSKPGNTRTKIVNVRNVSSSTFFISDSDLDDLFVDAKHAAKYLVSQDDILITRSGTPGAARMIAPSRESVVYCGFIIKMSFEDKKMKNYLFFKMKELEAAIQKKSAGSILSNISQDVLNNLDIVIPDENTLNAFNIQITPLLQKQLLNAQQIEALTTQRNTLLPLLMTGQIEF